MQVDVATVDDVIGVVDRVRVVNTLNASISQVEILTLNQSGEHLLLDGTHDEFGVTVCLARRVSG